jgi:MATE family multidrug resistance protein
MPGTSEDWGVEARRLMALAWPVMLVSLNWTLLQVTDIIVVGFAGTHEVAGFGASRAITFITLVAAIGWLSGILVTASRADGAGDLPETGHVLRRGLLLGVAIGLAGMVLLWLGAGQALRLLGVAEAVRPLAVDVVRIMALVFPAQMMVIAAANFLEGISQPRKVMAVNLSILPLNAMLAWALATGALGLPQMGARGAALATVISVWIGAALMIRSARHTSAGSNRGAENFSLSAWKAAMPGAWALAKFGIVPAISSALELAGFSWLIALSTQLGDVTTHAFQIVFSIHNMTFSFALGLGSAAGVRAGNAVGEGAPHEARRRTLIAAGLAAAVLGVLATFLLLFGGAVSGLFPATVAVGALAAAMFTVWAPFIVFDGLQVVFMFALRSLGDQVAAGLNAILSFFLITGGSGALLVAMGWGASALVWASGLGMLAAAALNGSRFWLVSSPQRLKSSD